MAFFFVLFSLLHANDCYARIIMERESDFDAYFTRALFFFRSRSSGRRAFLNLSFIRCNSSLDGIKAGYEIFSRKLLE